MSLTTNEAYLTQRFLHKTHGRLLAFRNTRQHFSIMLGDHLKHQNHQQNAQNYETWGTKYTWKGLVYRELQRGDSVTLLHLTWERARQATQIFRCSE